MLVVCAASNHESKLAMFILIIKLKRLQFLSNKYLKSCLYIQLTDEAVTSKGFFFLSISPTP